MIVVFIVFHPLINFNNHRWLTVIYLFFQVSVNHSLLSVEGSKYVKNYKKFLYKKYIIKNIEIYVQFTAMFPIVQWNLVATKMFIILKFGVEVAI